MNMLVVICWPHLAHVQIAWFDKPENNSAGLTNTLATETAYVRGAVADKAAMYLKFVGALAAGYAIALM